VSKTLPKAASISGLKSLFCSAKSNKGTFIYLFFVF
jgi:hypothetical protein